MRMDTIGGDDNSSDAGNDYEYRDGDDDNQNVDERHSDHDDKLSVYLDELEDEVDSDDQIDLKKGS